MFTPLFTDRSHAGRELAGAIESRGEFDEAVVVALPRGGVPVGYEVACRLGVPLDVIVVRKLGSPGHEELAMGAVASGGIVVRNQGVMDAGGVDDETFQRIVERKQLEVRDRDRLLRGDRPPLAIDAKAAIVVDDGVATGSTINAAIRGLRQLNPKRIVVAVPVAPPETVSALLTLADDVLCLHTPTPFVAVGAWYQDFTQVADKEVRRLLTAAESPG